MVSTTSIIVGIIFILIILILVVYFVYFNRVVQPIAILTNTGFTLSNNCNFITLQSEQTTETIPGVIPFLTLDTIPLGEFETGAQEWLFVNPDTGNIVTFIGADNSTTGGQVSHSGTKVVMVNTYTGAYVIVDDQGNLSAINMQYNSSSGPGGFLFPTAVFTLEYNSTNPRLISLLYSDGRYVIPGFLAGFLPFLADDSVPAAAVLGTPTSDSQKLWVVNGPACVPT